MTDDDLPGDLRELKVRHLARKWHIPREEARILLENQRHGGDDE